MKLPFLCIGLFLGVAVMASPRGDLNGDRQVDIGDLVRIGKIEQGELPFAAAADLDGDGAVTAGDVWLIREATRGRPVPELVAAASIGAAGARLTDGTITVDVGAGPATPKRLATSLSIRPCPVLHWRRRAAKWARSRSGP